MENLPDIPDTLIERLSHYFRTYKMQPGDRTEASIESVYHRQHAWEVIRSSLEDYREKWGE
ncbi:MAG: Inorganic pyrophosphatase [Candidatus Marinimicrobia bacterium]|nr:Inorganic pyrophosphatase [Candidatus Neomarinimicrobiota bacterium]